MIFLLDENFPKMAAGMLIERGHEVIDIRGTMEEGISDLSIFELAQKHHAVFLTTDKDFFHTIPHLYTQHFGIVVINLHQPNVNNIIAKLEWLLRHYDPSTFPSRVFLLRDQSVIVFPH